MNQVTYCECTRESHWGLSSTDLNPELTFTVGGVEGLVSLDEDVAGLEGH